MMKNLHYLAAEGCMLGVTIWGDQTKSNFLTIPDEAMKAHGIELPAKRTNFHLYNKLEELGAQSGWEVILQWEQNAPFPNLYLD